MRFVKIPSPVTFPRAVGPDGKPIEISIKMLVLDLWLDGPTDATTLAKIDMIVRTRGLFRSASPGDIIQIEEDAWAHLLATLETNTKLNPSVAIWLREEHPEFFDCIRYAPEQLLDS